MFICVIYLFILLISLFRLEVNDCLLRIRIVWFKPLFDDLNPLRFKLILWIILDFSLLISFGNRSFSFNPQLVKNQLCHSPRWVFHFISFQFFLALQQFLPQTFLRFRSVDLVFLIVSSQTEVVAQKPDRGCYIFCTFLVVREVILVVWKATIASARWLISRQKFLNVLFIQ